MSSDQYPPGDAINGSPHSVCVSLPTLADVIAYEEKDPALMARLQSGYPRFFRHPLIEGLAAGLCERHGLQGRRLVLVADMASSHALQKWADHSGRVFAAEGLYGVHFSEADEEGLQLAKSFLQHTGCGLSTRQAEALTGMQPHPEERDDGATEASLNQRLASAWRNGSAEDIYLCRGGMNALYTAFRILRDHQLQAERTLWVQLGWLYVDTIRILERMLPTGGSVIRHHDVCDIEGLAKALEPLKGRVAGFVTEVPTNPLIQTCPLDKLQGLARAHGAALIVDPSVVSPCNVDVLAKADVQICSLTKYAAAEGDVMAGAIALNPASPFYALLKREVPRVRCELAGQDLARLAHEAATYEEIVHSVNENTLRVAAHLQAHPSIDWVAWAGAPTAEDGYQSIRRPEGGPGALITFKVRGSAQAFYDTVRIAKSPSFGTRFSLLCPFMYLAHYDMVTSPDGRKELQRLGLHPELMRLSVGTEPVAELINYLDEALAAAAHSPELA